MPFTLVGKYSLISSHSRKVKSDHYVRFTAHDLLYVPKNIGEKAEMPKFEGSHDLKKSG